MTEPDAAFQAKRPEFRNINALTDIPRYRMPLAALVSILHRISGALLFLLLPFIIWMFDVSVSSEISFSRFTQLFDRGLALSPQAMVPGWLFKLLALLLIWAYLHHLIAGLRHLWMDITNSVGLEFGRHSAAATLVLSLGLTVVFGAKLFGAY